METKTDQDGENRPETSLSRKRNDQKLTDYCRSKNQYQQKYLKDQSAHSTSNNQQLDQSDRGDVVLSRQQKNSARDFQKVNSLLDARKFQIRSYQNLHQNSQKALKCCEDARYVPRNILTDQEQQYQEILRLKQIINYMKQENDSIRTRCQKMEEEHQRPRSHQLSKTFGSSKMFSNALDVNYINANQLQNQGVVTVKNMGGQYAHRLSSECEETNIKKELKKQIAELKQLAKQKDAEITQFKKTVNFTRTSELTIENKALQDECLRLKQMIENMHQVNKKISTVDKENAQNDQIELMNRQIQILKEDNITMAVNLKSSEEQLYQEKMKSKDQLAAIGNAKAELKKMKRYAAELECEIQKHKGNDPFLNQKKKNQNSIYMEQNVKNEIEKKDMEISALKVNLSMRERKFFEMEKKNNETRTELEEKLKEEIKEKQSLQSKLDKDQKTIAELREEIQQLSNLRNKMQANSERRQTYISQDRASSTNKLEAINNSEMKLINMQNKKLPVVNKQDVLDIAQNIKFKFMTKQIPIDDIDKHLFNAENLQSKYVTINELQQKFQQQPFKIENEDNAVLLARYLVENNTENYILFNLDLEQDINTVRSAFKQLIGRYQILSPDEQAKLQQSVTEVMLKQKANIIDYLNKEILRNNNNQVIEFCKLSEFEQAITQVESNLKPVEEEFLKSQLWSTTKNVNKVNLQAFLSKFNKDSHTDLPPIME